jgi:hypothetical protein
MTRFIIPPSKRVQQKPARPRPKRRAYPDQRDASGDGSPGRPYVKGSRVSPRK